MRCVVMVPPCVLDATATELSNSRGRSWEWNMATVVSVWRWIYWE